MMAIDDEVIDEVVAEIGNSGIDQSGLAPLRQRWPGIHFTSCSDDDILATVKPVRERDAYNVYLVTGAGGCIGFTSDLQSATGLVIAGIEAEDD